MDFTLPLVKSMAERSAALGRAGTMPRAKEGLLFVMTREYKRMKAELARVKRETKYVRLGGVTEDILQAEPDALYLVADFGQGWSKGVDLYLYFSPEKFGGRNDEERAWFVRFNQEKPSDDHDYVHGIDTYKWVSVPREDLLGVARGAGY